MILQMDQSILLFIEEHLHSAFFDRIFSFFTFLGDFGLLWIAICVGMLFCKRYRSCGLCGLAALILSFLIVNLGIKPFVARPRPFVEFPGIDLLIAKPSGFSFPSGHASSSFAAASVFFFFNKRKGAYALILAGIIAFSRLYLAVHFPSDILVGAALGILCGAAAILSYLFMRHLGRHHRLEMQKTKACHQMDYTLKNGQ